MKQLLFIFLAFIALSSCKDSPKDEIARLVKEWDGKEVRFPESPVFTIQGKDTVDFSFRNAEYKVVSYVDSIGCISCKLQLANWAAFIQEVDSLTGRTVPFILCLHTTDVEEMRRIVRKDDFQYPVFIDEKGTFDALNHFPTNMTFQTFLLDKDNKIVAIGNPVLNPMVKELYLEKLTGVQESKPKAMQTEVGLDKAEIDFGTFPMNEVKEGKFLLTNTGKNLLVVYDVITSCGCTKAEYSKTPARSGEALELTVRYEADESGHFNKVLTIYSNAVGSPHKIRVKGQVE